LPRSWAWSADPRTRIMRRRSGHGVATTHPGSRTVCDTSSEGLEATTGFEPVNRGFADPRVEPLHHVAPTGCIARSRDAGCPSRIRTSVHGSKVRCPTTRRRGSGAFGEDTGAEDGTRTRDPHLGKVMLYQLSHFRSMFDHPLDGAEGQDRTGDTAIFSRVLYRLSYLGPMVALRGCRRRSAGYHGPSRGCHRPAGSESSGSLAPRS
jgi:hypothetical protein